MKHLTRHILLTVVAVALLGIITAVAWLFATTEGARWLLREVPRVTDIVLGATSVEGTLWHGLRIEGLRLSSPGLEIVMQEFRIRWQPTMLLSGQVSIAELAGTGIRITDSRPKTVSTGPPGLNWPRMTGILTHLNIRVHDLSASQAVYRRLDEEPLTLERVSADLHFSHGRLTLRRMALAMPGLRLDGMVAAGFVRPSLRIDAVLAVSQPIAGMDRFSLNADLKPGPEAAAEGTVTMTARSRMTAVLDLRSRLELSNLTATLTDVRVRRPGRKGELTGAAEIDLAADVPAFHAALALANLDLSKEVPALSGVNGSLRIDGTPDSYRGRLTLLNKGPLWRSAALDADFHGTRSGIAVSSLTGQLLGGTLAGTADASWKDVRSASASVQLRGMNPALIEPGVNGTINMDLQGSAVLRKNRPFEGQLNLHLLKSDLHGYPLTGDMRARLRQNDLMLDRLALNSTGFGLKADGRARQGVHFSAALSDLSLLFPGIKGSVSASGVLRQNENRFSGSLSASGRNILAGELKARTVEVTGRVEDRKELPFSVSAAAHALNYGMVRLDSLALSGSGTTALHTLRAAARSSQYSIKAGLTGGYDRGSWNGAIVRLSGSDPQGNWSLQNKAQLVLSRDTFFLAPLTVRSTGSEQLVLSARLGIHPFSGTFSFEWRDIDLARANIWLAGGTLSGRSAGLITGKALPEERVNMSGRVSLSRATLTRRVQRTELKAEIEKAEAALAWQEENLSIRLTLALAGYGNLEGSLQIPLPARLPLSVNREGQVRGSLRGKFRENGTISFLFPGLVQESRGEFAVDVSVRGTWNAPEVKGSLLLDKAAGYFPAAGIHISDIHVEARIEQQSLHIDSLRAKSGPGNIRGKAVVRMQPGRTVRYEGTLQGEKFEALFLPQMRLQISPDLRFSGTTGKLTVRGEVQVPELLIYGPPRAAPVKPSEDVVIVGRKGAPAQSRMETDIEVRVVLGKRVIVKAEGADAQLGGELMISASSIDQVRARGEVTVTKGKYSAYGMSLAISRGRLLFSGPVDNPTLDILAVKTVNEVKAGVLVTGTVKKPVVRLYSEPAMPDADILSYIVLGHPLGGQDKQQASYLMQAAGALLSAGQSVALQDQVKHRLGLDTIDIETGSGSVGRSLITIGKYLAPQLYVSYGRALFTGENLFRLRYKFGKHWELESHSGETSGVDLYYTIHFD